MTAHDISPKIAVVAVILLAGVAIPSPAVGTTKATPPLPDEPALHVALNADGSARVTLVVLFNLTSTEEREAFRALRTNATAKEQRTEGFASRIRRIARRTATQTERDMQINRPGIEFIDRGDSGIVALSVTWSGIAAQSGGELVLREPFASGLTLDRSFHVVAPDEYRLLMVNPTPIEQSRTEATWAAETELDDFEARFVRSSTQTSQRSADIPETGINAPGIGITGITLVLIVGFLLYRVRYQA